MELRKFNNKIVTITDVDNQTFEGIVFLKIRVLLMKSIMLYLLRWMRLFENEIFKVEIADKIGQSKSP